MTKTGVIGAIGGIELPSIKLTFAESEGIPRKPAKEAAPAQVSAGADLLFHNADAAGSSVFQAAVQITHLCVRRKR
jgi:basic membrane lipoprotein Med (substrate-binding protein (PBP1-ABC) superfamily)